MCDCKMAYFTQGVIVHISCVMCDCYYSTITFHTHGGTHG